MRRARRASRNRMKKKVNKNKMRKMVKMSRMRMVKMNLRISRILARTRNKNYLTNSDKNKETDKKTERWLKKDNKSLDSTLCILN